MSDLTEYMKPNTHQDTNKIQNVFYTYKVRPPFPAVSCCPEPAFL